MPLELHVRAMACLEARLKRNVLGGKVASRLRDTNSAWIGPDARLRLRKIAIFDFASVIQHALTSHS